MNAEGAVRMQLSTILQQYEIIMFFKFEYYVIFLIKIYYLCSPLKKLNIFYSN